MCVFLIRSLTVECGTMEAIWDSLLCSICKKYLSVFPIKMYADRSVKCGRCNAIDDGGTVSKLYELTAGKMKFPCVNRYEGCREHLTPEEMEVHEYNNCSGTVISCPACNSNFQGHSFTIVQHFKQQHQTLVLKSPEVVIKFNDEIEEKYYIYASSVDNILVMIFVCYKENLFFDIAPIFKDKSKISYKLELWADNQILYKSEEKSNVVASSNGFYLSRNIGIPIQKLQYKEAATCKFYIIKKVHFHNLFEADKTKIGIPSKIVTPCNLKHVTDNPIMKPFKSISGPIEFTFSIDNVGSLVEGKCLYSSIFYLANISWKFYFEKFKNDLWVGLEKVNDSDQNKFSYRVTAKINLLSLHSIGNHDYAKPLKSSKAFGLRNFEIMGFGFLFMDWNHLKEGGFLGSKDDIEADATVELVEIIPHESRCPCAGCFE